MARNHDRRGKRPHSDDHEPAAADDGELGPAALAEAIRTAFAAQEPLLRQRLARLEAALQHADRAVRDRAAERLALVQVGLSCLTEAIDELAAELASPARRVQSYCRAAARAEDEA